MAKLLKRTDEVQVFSVLESDADATRASTHYHIVYCNEDTGEAVMAESEGHTHEVTYQPPQPANPQGPNSEAQPAQFVVAPAADGHTHELIDYILEVPENASEDETAVVGEVLQLFDAGLELESKSIKEGRKCEEFYEGEQWEEGLKKALEAANRAALTINLTEKNIDDLVGYQRQQRSEIHYSPVESGDQRTADLLNEVSKNILERCDWSMEEACLFEDTVVAGKGEIDITVDFSKDLRGDIKAERHQWDEVVRGEHKKLDGSDAEFLCKHRLHSWAEIKAKWPDKAEDIQMDIDLLLKPGAPHIQYQDDQYAEGDGVSHVVSVVGDTPMVDVQKKRFRVVECWRKIEETAFVAVNAEDDAFFNLWGWTKDDREAVLNLPGFQLVEKTEPKMRITTIAGARVLSDENPADLAADQFYTIPVYGKKRRNKYWGKVKAAQDPQREINKRHSQAIDIGNRMASYGWFVDGGTFPTESEMRKFQKQSSSPGFVQIVNDINRPPKQVEGVSFPREIAELMQISYERLRDLLNVVAEPTGANQSGAHFQAQQRARLIGNEFLFDHLNFSRKQMGRVLIQLIQRYYSADRIKRIVDRSVPAGPDQPRYSLEEIEDLLSKLDASHYDIVTTAAAATPTARFMTFMMLSELARSGVPVPPTVLIESSDLPQEEKSKMIQMFQQQAQAAQQAEAQKANAEIQKTLIAKGGSQPSAGNGARGAAG